MQVHRRRGCPATAPRAGRARPAPARDTRRSPRRRGSAACRRRPRSVTRPCTAASRTATLAASLTTGGTPRVCDDLDADAVRRRDGSDQLVDQRRQRLPQRRATASAASRARRRTAGSRWPRFRPSTCPQTSATPARGSTRRDNSAGTCVMTAPSAVTRSAVRCGRAVWPPGAGQPHLDVVAGGRDRPDPQPDLADVDRTGRSARRTSASMPVEAAGADDVERTAGHDLLGRLEDQPDAVRQLTRSPRAAAAQARRRARPWCARRDRRRARRRRPCER